MKNEKDWLHQVSAGGVVFRVSNTGIRICMIGRRSVKTKSLIWCLPKGHVEKGEDTPTAALREVREETGVVGEIINALGSIQYSFFDLESKKNVFKTVHFFLVEYQEGKLTDHDNEVECAKWFSMEEALKRAEYKGEQTILNKAIKKLSSSDGRKKESVA